MSFKNTGIILLIFLVQPSSIKVFASTHQESLWCEGSLLTKESGYLLSHRNYNGMNHYDDYKQCEVIIRVRRNERVHLHFDHFELEYHDQCSWDNLTVYDGSTSDNVLATLCGAKIPSDIFSSGRIVTLVFKTDHNMTYSGFKLSYKEDQSASSWCGGSRVLTGITGYITSHEHYDGMTKYDNYKTCQVTIKVRRGYRIRLQFEQFQLEYHDQCSWDHLLIHDGNSTKSKLLTRLCGEGALPFVYSSGSSLMLVLKTDHNQTYSGFKINYSEERLEYIRSNTMDTRTSNKENVPDMTCEIIQSESNESIIVPGRERSFTLGATDTGECGKYKAHCPVYSSKKISIKNDKVKLTTKPNVFWNIPYAYTKLGKDDSIKCRGYGFPTPKLNFTISKNDITVFFDTSEANITVPMSGITKGELYAAECTAINERGAATINATIYLATYPSNNFHLRSMGIRFNDLINLKLISVMLATYVILISRL